VPIQIAEDRKFDLSRAFPTFEMTVDLNVLDHLGINLYSNIAAVLTEAVANAWDADASRPSQIKSIRTATGSRSRTTASACPSMT
jgi:hypothetical protein